MRQMLAMAVDSERLCFPLSGKWLLTKEVAD
jgi:hypothetical protein